jgi:GDP-4-dehydro-6-deoxy-D-mannose reductase
MNVLITGASGFIGGYLVKQCLEAGSSVLGIDVREPGQTWAGAEFEHCDVRDQERLFDIISTFGPQRIFHLAAQSHPTESLVRPRETMDTNVGGTINLFESLRASRVRALVVVACSSAEYGKVANEDLPVRETHSLLPLHPYGVSKVAQDLLAAQYFANYSVPSIRLRIFNTTGPGQRGDVCSDLASQAIEIEMGVRPPLMVVGNVTNRRAILDVRDLVHAIWMSSEHCSPGEVYNVGADQTSSVQDLIEMIRAQLSVTFEVEQDPAIMRACDEPIVAGDNSKFRSCCAWMPKFQLATTICDMLNWWSLWLGGPARITPMSILSSRLKV